MAKLIQYSTRASQYSGAFDSEVGWAAAGMGYLIVTDGGRLIMIDGGYYAGNSLNRESSYTLYLIIDYMYDDEAVSSVIDALEKDGVVPGDMEQFGRSGGYIFGIE